MNFFVVKRKTIFAFLVFGLAVASVWLSANMMTRGDVPVLGSNEKEEARVVHMVTGEFKTELENGKELEVYRWDPGTIYMKQNERVELKILGVNGKEHPFHIEGTNITGTVKKGAETTIPLRFSEAGIYRLICTAHENYENSGPMIAYIIVD